MPTDNNSFYDGETPQRNTAQEVNSNTEGFVGNSSNNSLYGNGGASHGAQPDINRDEQTFVAKEADNAFYSGTDLEHRVPQRSPVNTGSFYKGQTFNVIITGEGGLLTFSNDTEDLKRTIFTSIGGSVSAIRNYSWIEIAAGRLLNESTNLNGDNVLHLRVGGPDGDEFYRLVQSSPEEDIIYTDSALTDEYTRR